MKQDKAKSVILRVGVYNNFNFTTAEIEEVHKYKEAGYLPFVNSNSFVTVTADFPSILTINPYLDSFVEPAGDISNVKACRIKVGASMCSRWAESVIKSIQFCADKSIPALITMQRFRSKESLTQWVDNSTDLYLFRAGYYRLTDAGQAKAMSDVYQVAASFKFPEELITVCDKSGGGCPDCGNCAKLAYGVTADADVRSLSLSCSGDAGKCIFHCPDCWAHCLSKITTFTYDKVTKNNKQKGKTSK